jgi:hypothetical protein
VNEDGTSSGDVAAREPEARIDLRETYRQQMLASIGGWQGTVITAVPPVVFVVVNATSGLRPAIYAAVGSAVLLALYRLVRKQSLQQAISGLIGVLIAALIAHRTGHARDYFLVGIWSSVGYGVVFAGSMLVRRPLVGLLWEFLDPSPGLAEGVSWTRERVLMRAYLWATFVATAVFAARAIVQLALFKQNATGWLAFARIAMGYPLWILAVGFGFWVVRRARAQLVSSAVEQPAVEETG